MAARLGAVRGSATAAKGAEVVCERPGRVSLRPLSIRQHLDVLHPAAVGGEPSTVVGGVDGHCLAVLRDNGMHRAGDAYGARGRDLVVRVLLNTRARAPAFGVDLDSARRV